MSEISLERIFPLGESDLEAGENHIRHAIRVVPVVIPEGEPDTLHPSNDLTKPAAPIPSSEVKYTSSSQQFLMVASVIGSIVRSKSRKWLTSKFR